MLLISSLLLRTKSFLPIFMNLLNTSKPVVYNARGYSKKSDEEDSNKPDPKCKKKKPGVLHKIKLRVLEGGSNFGTPFRRLKCDPEKSVEISKPKPKAEQEPAKKKMEPCLAPGVQVSILGANSIVGQYVAFLLKQCSAVRELHLYEAYNPISCECPPKLDGVMKALKNIDTDCVVAAYRCDCLDLRECLQDTDIVLMMESPSMTRDMPYQKRFTFQAPLVRHFTHAIIEECPEAFVVVSMTPIDCMVPLIAEILKQGSTYNPSKLIGSMAVQELRASHIVARALSLNPKYVRVPCVGGTEGKSLVPLLSRTVEYFDFTKHNADTLTKSVRYDPSAKVLKDGDPCACSANISKARAVAGLVMKVAQARLCQDTPQVTGFVQTDPSTVICPVRHFANTIELGCTGITRNLGIPKMNDHETEWVNAAMLELTARWRMVQDWHGKTLGSTARLDSFKFKCLSSTTGLDNPGYYSFCNDV